MIDSRQLLSLLGHSSLYEQLDGLLTTYGIKKRPKKIESTQYVFTDDKTVVLTFTLSDMFNEEALAPQKSDGNFVFSELTVHPGFSGSLPYGLHIGENGTCDRGEIGPPLATDSEFSSATYFYDGLVIVLRQSSKPKDAFIRFALPTTWDKKDLNLT